MVERGCMHKRNMMQEGKDAAICYKQGYSKDPVLES